jgi:hypothetical protein
MDAVEYVRDAYGSTLILVAPTLLARADEVIEFSASSEPVELWPPRKQAASPLGSEARWF